MTFVKYDKGKTGEGLLADLFLGGSIPSGDGEARNKEYL